MAIRSFLTSIIDLRQADVTPKTSKMELSVHFQAVQRVNGDWVGGVKWSIIDGRQAGSKPRTPVWELLCSAQIKVGLDEKCKIGEQ